MARTCLARQWLLSMLKAVTVVMTDSGIVTDHVVVTVVVAVVTWPVMSVEKGDISPGSAVIDVGLEEMT